jgi:hypothetical protein
MGKICTVSGCIIGNNVGKNVDLVRNLPLDDNWPKLTKNMFSISSTDYDTPGFYKVQMIHFGASIKYLDENWAEWLEKFESLLEGLSWRRAYAILTLEWPANGYDSRQYNYQWRYINSSIPRNWEFEGGPRVFNLK